MEPGNLLYTKKENLDRQDHRAVLKAPLIATLMIR
jgi:hypothetical protein